MKMRDLLKDPLYRAYFLKNPRFPYALACTDPWTVWVRNESKKRPGKYVWGRRDMATFRDCVQFIKPRMNDWEDFSITSRIIAFDPPHEVRNAFRHNDWCKRCRRPVELRVFRKHHALSADIHVYFADWPVCPFCGGSDVTQITTVKG